MATPGERISGEAIIAKPNVTRKVNHARQRTDLKLHDVVASVLEPDALVGLLPTAG